MNITKKRLWDEDFRNGSDLPDCITKELCFFYLNLKDKVVTIDSKEQKLTLAYIANHCVDTLFGQKNRGIRSRCHQKLINWSKKPRPPTAIKAKEAPITSALHSTFFPNHNFSDHMSDDETFSDSYDNDSDSTASSISLPKRKSPKPTTKKTPAPAPAKASPKNSRPPRINMSKEPSSHSMEQWSYRTVENSEACG